MDIHREVRKVAGFSIIMLLVGCGGVDKGSFTDQQICVATVAATMGKDPSIIRVNSVKGSITHLYYYRKDDGTRYDYRCKLEENNAIWASDTGRWRTDTYDPKITFSVDGDSLNIEEKYSDGSNVRKSYNIKQLGS